jgi:hypothetical protein
MISESHNPFVPIDYFVVLFKHFFYPSTIHHCVLHFPKQKFDTKDPNGAEHGALLPRFPSRIFGKRSNRTEDKNPASVCPNRAQSLRFFQGAITVQQILEDHITWFSQHRNAASRRGGGEGLRLQSQQGQDLCATAAAGHLMLKTSTEDQTVHLTNKGMTKDSERFSPWFHSAWRTTGPIL